MKGGQSLAAAVNVSAWFPTALGRQAGGDQSLLTTVNMSAAFVIAAVTSQKGRALALEWLKLMAHQQSRKEKGHCVNSDLLKLG